VKGNSDRGWSKSLSLVKGSQEFRLPPLILHPFSQQPNPASLLEGSRAQLILSGLHPAPDDGRDDLERLILAGRYQEIRMLFFIGKDVFRWMEQCKDFVARNPALKEIGIQEQSFSALLVESPPPVLQEKLRTWGVTDGRGVFSRAIGMNAVFSDPPAIEILSTIFLQTYHRFCDHFYACYQNMMPFLELDSDQFHFEIYASEDYARKLAEGWE
jgi:hypothetical protein